jgi:hypothetical protein
MGYGLDGRCSIPSGEIFFSLLHSVQTGSGPFQPSSYPVGTGGSFPKGIKCPGRESDHSPPSSAEVKKMWICTSTPQYVFMEYFLIDYVQGKFYPYVYNIIT